jgi:MauM/NapG family ferredoxin protein
MIFAVMAFFSVNTRRFWCKYICPSGALLGLLARFSIYKRKVGKCGGCGACDRNCPMNAISSHRKCRFDECIVCRTCVRVCEMGGVSFGKTGHGGTYGEWLSRRALLNGALLGVSTAALTVNELASMLYNPREHGLIVPEDLLRPPGALTENIFLSKCIRCAECMLVCPTNGLQPLGLTAGTAALLSPILVPRRGNCEVDCALCGSACPTGAIQELVLEEKQQAKIGTARVNREHCIAWVEDKTCLVCQEVCPYNAITLEAETGHISTVPHVAPARCFGCGACENSCPLETSAILTFPDGQLRLNTPNYITAAANNGLELKIKEKDLITPNTDSVNDNNALPPGFIFE